MRIKAKRGESTQKAQRHGVRSGTDPMRNRKADYTTFVTLPLSFQILIIECRALGIRFQPIQHHAVELATILHTMLTLEPTWV